MNVNRALVALLLLCTIGAATVIGEDINRVNHGVVFRYLNEINLITEKIQYSFVVELPQLDINNIGTPRSNSNEKEHDKSGATDSGIQAQNAIKEIYINTEARHRENAYSQILDRRHT